MRNPPALKLRWASLPAADKPGRGAGNYELRMTNYECEYMNHKGHRKRLCDLCVKPSCSLWLLNFVFSIVRENASVRNLPAADKPGRGADPPAQRLRWASLLRFDRSGGRLGLGGLKEIFYLSENCSEMDMLLIYSYL